MSELKWIKIVTDIFDNRKIKVIESLPNGDSILVIWLKILCLAGKCNSNGNLMITENIPYTLDMMVNEFQRPINTIKLALATFIKFDMIEVFEDIYSVAGWNKYQNIESMDKIREQNRLRKQSQRERQLMSRDNHVTVTPSHAIELEEEIRSKNKEIESKKESKKDTKNMNLKITFDSIIESYTVNETLRHELKEHLKTRKAKKATLTNYAIELSLKKLDKLANSDEEKIKLVQTAIERGWTSFFQTNDFSNQETNITKKNNKYDTGEIL